ncbi:MAG: type II toxin-antitoxin system VapB family antitoxin [Pseudomonadota bacterium]
MASLFIKDKEANDLAEKLANDRGLTKTAAVKLALANELRRSDKRTARERMEDFWKRHPLPPRLGPAPDKAFWDDLSGDV